MRLDFVVPGFSKCGTTSLCAHLAKHPEVFIPEIKEPSFFAHRFERGWPWYEALFKEAGGARVLGEGSTSYSSAEYAETSCRRLVEHVPDVRLIFVARNPIARLESSFRQHHHSGHKYGIDVPRSIGSAVWEFRNMVDDTLYWQRISTYRKYVPDSRIHVLFLEDFVRDPAGELAGCYEFLGVDPSVRIARLDEKLNSGSTKLYDSRLLAYLRRYGPLGRIWERLSVDSWDRLMRFLRLRKPFRDPVRWDRASLDWVLEQIAEDSRQFLSHYGKPSDFWDLNPKVVTARSPLSTEKAPMRNAWQRLKKAFAGRDRPLGNRAVKRDLGMIDAKQSGWFKHTGELLEGFLIRAEDTVIDVGCGSGMACDYAASRGAEVIAVDIDPQMVDTVEKKLRRSRARAFQAIVSDSNPLPVPDGVASKVISMEVLEHVDDPSKFLSELVRVGKPGAQYLITVPDPTAETVQRDIAPAEYWDRPNHIHVFPREELDRLVEEVGLEIQRRVHYGFYWSMWWILFWATEGGFAFGAPGAPVLNYWNRTWRALISNPKSAHITKALNELMPKSQVLIARKAA